MFLFYLTAITLLEIVEQGTVPIRLHNGAQKLCKFGMAFQICITFFTFTPPIALYVLAVVKQFFVKRVLAKRLRRTEYDEFVAGTGYGHIHASEV